MKNSLSRKQIPTLLGIGILVVSLVAGVVFLNVAGTGFLPRATAQSTPKNPVISNVKDTSFTVSFLTDESTPGFLKYGTDQSNLKLQVGDDRDQLSGSVGQFTTHFITVRQLNPSTTYYFKLGTGTSSSFDNNGSPFTVKTAVAAGTPTAAKTAYGSVNNAQGTAASGAIVYVDIDGTGKLSALVKDSGSWAIPLSTARTTDGSAYANITNDSMMTIKVQGLQVSSTASTAVKVSDSQPVPVITLGGDNSAAGNSTANATPSATTAAFVQATPEVSASPTYITPTLQVTPAPSPTPATTVNVASGSGQVVGTSQPTITGTASAKTKVNIMIHSQTAISTQVQTDASGNYQVDLTQLKKTLEPGQHTITVSYVDPNTGKTVTQTQTFTVTAADAGLASPSPTSALIASTDTGLGGSNNTGSGSNLTPYGSSNPYTISTSPTPIATNSGSVAPITQPDFSMPATGSAMPKSGSTETTIALIAGGMFFLGAGGISFAISRQHETYELIEDEETE